jgi:hypothetical protein
VCTQAALGDDMFSQHSMNMQNEQNMWLSESQQLCHFMH